MDWFYVENGKQAGPVSEAQLDELLRSGRIEAATLVWREGLSQWQPWQTVRASSPSLSPPHGVITASCAECQRVLPQSEMIALNQSWICASCKPIFVQRLREGVGPAGGVIWRYKRQMVMRHETPMPDCCVKCNAPANGQRLTRKLYWHPPAYYLLIFVNLLVYLIVAIFVSRKVIIHIGLCDTHRKRRIWIIAGCWGAALAGLFLVAGGIGVDSIGLILLGFFVLLTALIVGAVLGSQVSAAKIDKEFAWVRGAGRDFLNDRPEWNGPQ